MNTFEERLDELAQTANRADLHCTIWWIYKHERPAYVGVMNAFLGFFRVSIGAHFAAMVIELYKLLDPRSDSVSLRSLLDEADRDCKLDPKTLASLKQKVAGLDPMWQKVRLLRHKLFAHRDRQLSYDSVLAQAAVTPDEIRDLVERSFEVLNQAFASRSIGTWPRDYRTERDTHRLLDALRTLNGATAPNSTTLGGPGTAGERCGISENF